MIDRREDEKCEEADEGALRKAFAPVERNEFYQLRLLMEAVLWDEGPG